MDQTDGELPNEHHRQGIVLVTSGTLTLVTVEWHFLPWLKQEGFDGQLKVSKMGFNFMHKHILLPCI